MKAEEEIAAGVRTVVHVAGHFRELKDVASQLVQRVDAEERGYFIPAEEEETVAMMVSYWHARNALLDLIASYRLDSNPSEGYQPSMFLTAFAASLTLVDSARFLRETVHDRYVLRRKLNEPSPMLGLPADAYEKVQASLLSAWQAWHLYYAIKYFDENEQSLREMAASGQFASVMEIIDRLRHRLRVSVRQFANAKLRARARHVFHGLLGDTFYRAMYGLQKLSSTMISGRYVRRGHRPRLPDEITTSLRTLMQPGDVIIARKDYALTNYFLPGYWPHAMLYLGDEADFQQLGLRQSEHAQQRWSKLLRAADEESGAVLESLKDGVLIRPLSSPFASDSVVVLRPRLSKDDLSHALGRVLKHEGKRYDFDFDFTRSDRLVCTEVVYRAYEGIGSIHFDLTRRMGRLSLSGCDLIGMGLDHKHFDPVALFAPSFAPGLLTGADTEPVLLSAQQRVKMSMADYSPLNGVVGSRLG